MTRSWRALLPAAALAVVPVLLVLIQPDLGTGLSIAAGAAVVVVFLAGLPIRWFFGAVWPEQLAPVAFFYAAS